MKHMARVALPPNVHNLLRHLGVDLGIPVNELLLQGALLILHRHGRGAGLPEVKSPGPKTTLEAEGGGQ